MLKKEISHINVTQSHRKNTYKQFMEEIQIGNGILLFVLFQLHLFFVSFLLFSAFFCIKWIFFMIPFDFLCFLANSLGFLVLFQWLLQGLQDTTLIYHSLPSGDIRLHHVQSNNLTLYTSILPPLQYFHTITYINVKTIQYNGVVFSPLLLVLCMH